MCLSSSTLGSLSSLLTSLSSLSVGGVSASSRPPSSSKSSSSVPVDELYLVFLRHGPASPSSSSGRTGHGTKHAAVANRFVVGGTNKTRGVTFAVHTTLRAVAGQLHNLRGTNVLTHRAVAGQLRDRRGTNVLTLRTDANWFSSVQGRACVCV